jgi:hypothetical protein
MLTMDLNETNVVSPDEDNKTMDMTNVNEKPKVFQKQNEINYNTMDKILENEKQNNKNDSWNKLDNTVKIQKLNTFAEKYGKINNIPSKDIKLLKSFFNDCIDKSKLNKSKDVLYDKETKEIISIPALHFNNTTKNYTLRIMDTKRVSTLKSLTPKRVVEKPKEVIIVDDTPI